MQQKHDCEAIPAWNAKKWHYTTAFSPGFRKQQNGLQWFQYIYTSRLSHRRFYNYFQSEGSERIIQVPGCDDCTGLGHDKTLVSIPVAPPGAGVSKVLIDSGSFLYHQINV